MEQINVQNLELQFCGSTLLGFQKNNFWRLLGFQWILKAAV